MPDNPVRAVQSQPISSQFCLPCIFSHFIFKTASDRIFPSTLFSGLVALLDVNKMKLFVSFTFYRPKRLWQCRLVDTRPNLMSRWHCCLMAFRIVRRFFILTIVYLYLIFGWQNWHCHTRKEGCDLLAFLNCPLLLEADGMGGLLWDAKPGHLFCYFFYIP